MGEGGAGRKEREGERISSRHPTEHGDSHGGQSHDPEMTT